MHEVFKGNRLIEIIEKWKIESERKVTIRTVASIQAGELAVDACSLQAAGRRAAAYTLPVLQTKGTLLRWSQKSNTT